MTLPMAKLVAATGQRLEALNQAIESAEARQALATSPLAPAPAVTPDQLTARADALAARLLAGAESAMELADRLHAAPQIRAQEIGLATRLADADDGGGCSRRAVDQRMRGRVRARVERQPDAVGVAADELDGDLAGQ